MTWLALAECRLGSRDAADEMRGLLDRDEREHCAASPSPDRLLGRVASKRAVCRALGQAGIEATPRTVAIRRAPSGRPVVLVDGVVRDPVLGCLASRLPLVIVSISHVSGAGVALAQAWPTSTRPLPCVGIDVVGKAWVGRHRPRGESDLLARRVLTPGELRAAAWATPIGLGYAVAAKEAVGKALRWSTGPLSWHGVEITGGNDGRAEGADRLVDVFAAQGWVESRRARWVTTRRSAAASGVVLFADLGEFLVAAVAGR